MWWIEITSSLHSVSELLINFPFPYNRENTTSGVLTVPFFKGKGMLLSNPSAWMPEIASELLNWKINYIDVSCEVISKEWLVLWCAESLSHNSRKEGMSYRKALGKQVNMSLIRHYKHPNWKVNTNLIRHYKHHNWKVKCQGSKLFYRNLHC